MQQFIEHMQMGVEHVYHLNNKQSIYLYIFISLYCSLYNILTCSPYLLKISAKQKQIPQNELKCFQMKMALYMPYIFPMLYTRQNIRTYGIAATDIQILTVRIYK